MSSNRQLSLIHLSGSHKEIGRQLGEACRQQVAHSIENARALLDEAYYDLELTWEGAQIQSRKYLPFAEENYPQYVEEMAGIAQGANVPFDEVVVLNVMEAVASDALHLTKCTSMAVNQQRTANNKVLVGHNEDWIPEDEPDVVLLKVTPLDEPAFLAMTYGGLLPNIGFNERGICQCCDTVYPKDSRIGVPRVIVSRAVLSAKTISDAIRMTLIPRRAAGYNHLIAHESGEIYNVEVSSRQFAIQYGEDGYITHTNHFLDPVMQKIEDEPEVLVSTRVRYFRALRRIKETENHTVETLQSILMDHVNYPDSVCNHIDQRDKPLDREKTITSLVFDLTEGRLHASWGNPCENVYHTYQL
jgi:isopenicillin-N N-acyltransferase like protein